MAMKVDIKTIGVAGGLLASALLVGYTTYEVHKNHKEIEKLEAIAKRNNDALDILMEFIGNSTVIVEDDVLEDDVDGENDAD